MRSGLYTANGAQFMIGSCHTMRVVHKNISIAGLPGLRRHPRMNTTSSTISMITVEICRNAM